MLKRKDNVTTMKLKINNVYDNLDN